MKILLSLIFVLFFSGCATDYYYGIGKTIYVNGKKVVIMNSDLIDDKTMEKLKKIDDKAIRYNNTREMLKKNVDINSTIDK